MRFGFTGTRKGMTDAQGLTLRNLLVDFGVEELHLGDCVGADAQAHLLALQVMMREKRRVWLVGHPPDDPKYRAFLPYHDEWEEKPYMDRNDDIVTGGEDGLFATPATAKEVIRSGTWATVRRGDAAGRELFIIRPDGSVR